MLNSELETRESKLTFREKELNRREQNLQETMLLEQENAPTEMQVADISMFRSPGIDKFKGLTIDRTPNSSRSLALTRMSISPQTTQKPQKSRHRVFQLKNANAW